MNKKNKNLILVAVIALMIICAFMLYKATKKVVYIEYIKAGQNCDDVLEMNNNDFVIEQEFTIPYKMFYGLGFAIGTYGRENNSRYEMIIMDKTTNQQIVSYEFNTSKAKDNEFYEIILDSPVEVDNTHQFSVILKAKTIVNFENGIAFYADKNSEIKENTGNLYYNNSPHDSTLCMNIYGGNSNTFWIIFTLGCEIYVVGLIVYILYLYISKKSIRQNPFVQAGLLGIVVFSMLSVFSSKINFTDEVDNIIGGMLINRGKIIYVDYYTQHTPFAYFLCAFFAIFQAGSIEQFRLMYYVLIAFAYIGLYLRHKGNFGKTKMFLLPIIQIAFGVLLTTETTMILSDNIQAICMIALTLEFLQYLKDEKLDWKRSIIVSLSIFCSFGSAFVSVYAIFAICLGVFIKEIIYWGNNKSISFKKCVNRYWKLIISCVIPFAIALVYFVATHSLVEFYEQSFKFNTEVYSYYLKNGFGSNVIQPFVIGIANFIKIIPGAIESIFEKEDIITCLVKIIIDVAILIILTNMIRKKEYLKAIVIAMFISFGFTRTNESFHSITAWAIMLTVILVYCDFHNMNTVQKTVSKVVFIIVAIFMIGSYMDKSMYFLFSKETPISALDQKVIQETSEGEEIFFDIYSNSSVYLIYKNRLPINRLGFILPWYMDWYELDTIDDLMTKRPRVVVYDEELKAWEISGYDDYLRKYLHENYEQTSETKKVWLLKQ